MSRRGQPQYHLEGLVKRRVAGDFVFELVVEHLRIEAGAALALVGESGCGKSTLLDLLALALKPDHATSFRFALSADEQADIAHLWRRGGADAPLSQLRGRCCGYVLQTGGLLPFLSVYDNIALAQRIAGCYDRRQIYYLAERLGIARELKRLPAAMSVGQRQRAAIARAIAHRPRVVLADEPTASVNPALADEIFDLLVELVAEYGTTLIVASHDLPRLERWGLSRLICRQQLTPGRCRSTFTPPPPLPPPPPAPPRATGWSWAL